MKKGIHFLTALVLVLLLTGCARINIDVNIKENGKVDMSMLYAFIEAASEGTEILSAEDIKELTDEGWEYADYNEDGYVGYTLNIKDRDIKDLEQAFMDPDTGVEAGGSYSIKLEDGKYIFDLDLLGESDADMRYETKEYIAMYGGYVTVTIHVPQPALDSNATYVTDEGKTLTWDLLEMSPGETIHAEFKMSRFRPARMIGVTAATVAALLVIILIVVLVGRKAKSRNAAAGAKGYSGQDVNMAQGTEAPSPYAGQQGGAPVYTYGSQQTPPSQKIQPNFCPQCGARISVPSSYCQQCGSKLS
ncbi:MAG: zinc ribbon domain-containing protein [Butyrivibrio sp.]|nr:zinc ribbon domain-containing protein [Butyrivibrio sp.]